MSWAELRLAAIVGAFAASLAVISFGIEHPLAHAVLHQATVLASVVGAVGAWLIGRTEVDPQRHRRDRMDHLRRRPWGRP